MLETALKENLDGVVVLGFAPDGDIFTATSLNDRAEIVYVLERFKFDVLAGVDEEPPDPKIG